MVFLESDFKNKAFYRTTVVKKLAESLKAHYRVKEWITYGENKRIKRRERNVKRDNMLRERK